LCAGIRVDDELDVENRECDQAIRRFGISRSLIRHESAPSPWIFIALDPSGA
jgi:hypothetical protein